MLALGTITFHITMKKGTPEKAKIWGKLSKGQALGKILKLCPSLLMLSENYFIKLDTINPREQRKTFLGQF